MAALLAYFQALLGRKAFIVALAVAALGAFSFEYSNVFSAYFNAYIQDQLAAVSKEKAKGEADLAAAAAREKAAQARTAEEIAANAKLRQQMEAMLATAAAREKEAQARTAEEVAANAKLRQEMEAMLAAGTAREKEAQAKTAEQVAAFSHAMQEATLAAKQAEARKIDADATQSEYIACAMDDSKCSPWQRCLLEGTTGGVGSRVMTLSSAAVDTLSPDSPLQLSRAQRCANVRNATTYETPKIPANVPQQCRPLYADWTRQPAHSAFALTNTNNCVWSGDGGYPSVEAAIEKIRGHCWRQNFRCTIIATK